MKYTTWMATALIVVAGSTACSAGEFGLSAPFTDDASSGISSSNTYTHAISGGTAVSVNGVSFEALTDAVTPANFDWNTNTFSKNLVTNNFGDWAGGGTVTGPETIALLKDFTYSGNGANQPASQTFTLTGLTPGQQYDFRFYIRPWDDAGSGRPIDFTFTNGSEVDTVAGPEDRPGTVLGTGDEMSAFYLSYKYTAQLDNLVIDAAVGSAENNSGSFHMYGLSNQVVPEPSCFALLAMAACS
ncbi:MAG: hypothetical protein KDA99_13005, partial [Planctomycetales bacterium]|nr:hypothetical protein [Planctomycetales bacterium]